MRDAPVDANLPGAWYPSQPRTVTQETTFGNLAQQAARFARGAVWKDRHGSRRLGGQAVAGYRCVVDLEQARSPLGEPRIGDSHIPEGIDKIAKAVPDARVAEPASEDEESRS